MIEAENLTKKYGPTVAVEDLSFTVPDGSVTGFLGPNGAGKSTTMRCLLGLDRPNSGKILFDGLPFHGHSCPVEAAGAVLDASWYHPGRTGRGHLQVVAASAGLPSTRVGEVLDAVGLGTAAHRRIRGYSLGMKQRLGLATSLLGDPRNLVLDEPANGLDPEGVHWMRSVLRRNADDGRAVLVSSHLLSEMQLVADRLVVVGRGRLICESGMAEFLDRHSGKAIVRTDADEVLERCLRETGVAATRRPDGLNVTYNSVVPDASALSRLCRDLGLLVTALGDEPVGLEEIFLELTETASVYRAQN